MQILSHLSEAEYDYPINDLCYFLKRLATLKEQGCRTDFMLTI